MYEGFKITRNHVIIILLPCPTFQLKSCFLVTNGMRIVEFFVLSSNSPVMGKNISNLGVEYVVEQDS